MTIDRDKVLALAREIRDAAKDIDDILCPYDRTETALRWADRIEALASAKPAEAVDRAMPDGATFEDYRDQLACGGLTPIDQMAFDNMLHDRIAHDAAQGAAAPFAWYLVGEDGKPAFAPYFNESDADAMIADFANARLSEYREMFTKHPLYTHPTPDTKSDELDPTGTAYVLHHMSKHRNDNTTAAELLGLAEVWEKLRGAGRYYCSGPQGDFVCDDLELARALVNAYDKQDDWTITDMDKPAVEPDLAEGIASGEIGADPGIEVGATTHPKRGESDG